MAVDLLAPLIRYAIAPAWARWERSPYLAHHRRLKQTQYDAPDVIARRQWDAVGRMVAHAAETVPFWQERLAAAGLSVAEAQRAPGFFAIPPLEKSDLRSQREELIALPYRQAELTRKKTSGSTGVSVEVYVDEYAQQFKRGCTLRSDEWCGWRLGDPMAMVWGNPPTLARGWRARLRNALLERRYALDTLKMGRADMARFAEELRRRPPGMLFGHAHSLYLLANFLRQEQITDLRPRGIISSSMVLHDFERRVIEAVFGCRVTNRYGCEEVSLIACECERHDGLHVNADNVLVEIVRPDGTPAAPGETGAILVTDLVNRAMPILRYRVGDLAAPSTRRCPCGRGLPLVERIEGRIADYVLLPSGEMISGISLTENFAMLVPGVVQLQIIQETLTELVFRIVRGPEFHDASARRVGELVAERFGDNMRYTCEFVERILPEPSGKYRFCISKVANPFSPPAPAPLPAAGTEGVLANT